MLRGINPDITRENMTAIVDILREKDIKIALTAVQAPMNYGLKFANKFNGIYKDIADKYDLELHPFLLEAIYKKKGMMLADGIHPSAEGTKVIVESLAPFIVEVMED